MTEPEPLLKKDIIINAFEGKVDFDDTDIFIGRVFKLDKIRSAYLLAVKEIEKESNKLSGLDKVGAVMACQAYHLAQDILKKAFQAVSDEDEN